MDLLLGNYGYLFSNLKTKTIVGVCQGCQNIILFFIPMQWLIDICSGWFGEHEDAFKINKHIGKYKLYLLSGFSLIIKIFN